MTFNYRSPGIDAALYGYDESRAAGDGLSVSAHGPNGYVWVPYQDVPAVIEGLLAGPDEGDDGEPAETASEREERFTAMAGSGHVDVQQPPLGLVKLTAVLLDRIVSESDYVTWARSSSVAVVDAIAELAAAAAMLRDKLAPGPDATEREFGTPDKRVFDGMRSAHSDGQGEWLDLVTVAAYAGMQLGQADVVLEGLVESGAVERRGHDDAWRLPASNG